jgi:hypothetical protein
MKNWIAVFLTVVTALGFGQRSSVGTFSNADAARIFQQACGVPSRSNALHVHRLSSGNMIYVISEDHREAILYASTQQCNQISTETLDVWRDDKGNAVAQLIDKDSMRMLMVGDFDPIRGSRFDVDHSGQYLCISNGNASIISAVARPYRTLLTLNNFDAQRIFARNKELLLVGSNPTANTMEARAVSISPTGMIENPPMTLKNMPGGIWVLDYSSKSDELLLGGTNATGQTSIVLYDMNSGQASSIPLEKPGDDNALFIADAGVRNRLTGRSTGAPGPNSSFNSESQPQQKPARKSGLLDFFRGHKK